MPSRRAAFLEILAFTGLSVLPLGLIAATPYLPTQDGPEHLATARVALEYPKSDLARAYYEPTSIPTPTRYATVALAFLMRKWPPETAWKLLAGVYVLALPWAARWLVSTRGGRAEGAWLAFPFVLSYPFHMGFVTFCLSLVMAILSLGLRGPPLRAPGLPRLFGLALLLVATYLAHPIGLLVAVVALGMDAVVAWSHRRASWTYGVATLVATLPAFALALLLRLQQDVAASSRLPWSVRWRMLVQLDPLVSFRPAELVLSTALAALLLVGTGLALARRRGRIREVGLIASASALGALALLLPNSLVNSVGTTAGGWITHRLVLAAWLVLALWIGLQGWGRWGRTLCVVTGAVAAVGLLILLAPVYGRYSELASEVAELDEALPPHLVFWPVVLDDRGSRLGPDGNALSLKTRLLAHLFARLAASDRERIDLGAYQPASRGLFAFKFRDAVDPGRLPGARVGGLRMIDPRSYERGPGRIDAVVVWGEAGSAAGETLERFLETTGYRLARHTSGGHARAYLHRGRFPG